MLFKTLSEYYEKIYQTASRIEMVGILSEIFKQCSIEEISKIIYITQGQLAPTFEGIEFGIADKIVEEAISVATGYSKEEIEVQYHKTGDLGLVAELFSKSSKLRRMSDKKFTVLDVYSSMYKIATTSGKNSKELKIRMLSDLIASSEPVEAKYMVKYPLNELRLGAGDETILEALSLTITGTRSKKDVMDRAYNICSDLGEIGEMSLKGGIEAIENMKVSLFKPIRPALAERLPTPEEILKKMGGKCAVEQKYDGFRCQVHKDGNKVKLYSRRLEETTEMMPDIVKAVINDIKVDKVIFEGEALAYNESTNEFLPFQETIQRKRKHGISEKIIELPLHLMSFDIMYLEGKDLLGEPYEKRRALLEDVVKDSNTISPSKRILTDSAKEFEEFFEDSVENGLEGIVAKDLKSHYIAGARKFSWIKMKRSYRGELSDSLDLVIVGYYLGKGSRAEFKFGGLLCAVYNKEKDMFETISKLGTGFTEDQMVELQSLLTKIKVDEKPARVDSIMKPDFWVYPKYVVTVKADEITKSPMHTCGRSKQPDGTEVGYALRFPRLIGDTTIRGDKSPEEATETKEVIEMFDQQKRVSISKKS